MSRVIYAIATVLLLASLADSRADIIISTIDANGGTPSGLQRYDEETGIALPGGDVPASSIPLSQSFAAPAFPTDVATAPDGRLFMVDGAGFVLHFDGATGAPLTSPIPMAPDGLFTARATPPTASGFTSLTFGPDELLYVLDADDVSGNGDKPGIRIFDAVTSAPVDTLLEAATTTFVSATAITFDNAGDLLISDRDASTIYKVDVQADTIAPFITPAAGGALGPAGMVVAPTGEVFVADLFGNRIIRYDSDGTNPTLFAAIPPLPAPNPPGSNFPSDLIMNREGDRLLVAVLGAEDPDEEGSAAGQILSYALAGGEPTVIAENLRPTSSLALTADLLPGDYNGDAVVDVIDYVAWTDEFGSSVRITQGADGSGDGTVGLADYTTWRDTLGASGAALSANSVSANSASRIPEPAAATLLALALCYWGLARPKANRSHTFTA